jgi:FkbM family methyltransferase
MRSPFLATTPLVNRDGPPGPIRRWLAGITVALLGRRAPPNAYLGDHTTLTMLERRLMIFLDTRGADLVPHLLMEGRWERASTAIFQRLVRPGDTVLDVGANVGVYTLLAAEAVGNKGRVFGFEPNNRYATLASRSIAINALEGRAQICNAAVGEAAGESELVFAWSWGGGGRLADGTAVDASYERQPCQVLALDEVFADPAFRADVVKIDIEGGEGRALRGMWQLLERSPEVRLLFEFAPDMLAAHGVGPAEAIHLLDELGFRFWTIDNKARLAPIEATALTGMQGGVRNILAARGRPFRPRGGAR